MQLKVETIHRKSPGEKKRLKQVVNGRYGQTSRAFVRYSYLLNAKMPLHLLIFSWLFHPAAICGTTQKAIARFDNTCVTPKSIASNYSRKILSDRIYDRSRDRSLPASFASASALREILSQRIFSDLSRSRDLSSWFEARSRDREKRVDEFENQALARIRCGTSTFAMKRRRRDKRKRARGRGRGEERKRKRAGEVPRDDREERERIVPDASRVTSALRIRASRAIAAACAMQDAGMSPAPDCVLLCPASADTWYSSDLRSQDRHEKRVDVHTYHSWKTLRSRNARRGRINRGDTTAGRRTS